MMIQERHCPQCNRILVPHIVRDLFGNETEYVENCPSGECGFSRVRRVKSQSALPMRDPNAGRANG